MIWVVVGVLAAFFLTAGFASKHAPQVTQFAYRAATLGYITFILASIIWFAICPSCTSLVSDDSARFADVIVAVIWGLVLWVGYMALTAVGGLVSRLLFRPGEGE